MESTDLSALRQTTSILCLRLSELLLDTDLHANHTKMGDIIFTLTSVSRALCAFDRPPGSTLDSIIQISSRFEQAIVGQDYVGKDGDIVYEIGDPPDPIGGPSGGRGDSVWSEAVRAESEEEFYSILRDGAPRYYIYITDNSNNTPRSSMEFVHNHTNRQPLRTLLDRELPNGRARRLSETTEEDTDGEV